MFDLANTAFLTGVMGLMFPLWVTRTFGADDADVAYTITGAMLVLLVAAPLSGTLLGQARRRLPPLGAVTLVAIISTMLLGTGSLIPSLALFALAICAFQIGQIIYVSLLPEVSPSKNWGVISGLGIGIGYLGSLLAVGLAILLPSESQYAFGFRILSALFAVFALPLFFFVKERPREVRAVRLGAKLAGSVSQLALSLQHAVQSQPLRRFLLARIFFTMSVNTAASFAVLYATKTVGLAVREVELVLLVGIACAVPSGAIWGYLSDRFSPKRTLTIALGGLIVIFSLSLGIPWLDLPPRLWWGVGILSGICIAGTWAADRPMMLRFIPRGREGEYLGIHSLTARVSFVLGPFLWGFVAVTLGLGQPAALTVLIVLLALAVVILLGMQAGPGKGPLLKAEAGLATVRLSDTGSARRPGVRKSASRAASQNQPEHPQPIDPDEEQEKSASGPLTRVQPS